MKISFLSMFAALAMVAGVNAATIGSFTATDDPNVAPDGLDQNNNPVDVWTVTHSGSGTAPNNYGSFLGNSSQNGGGSGAGAGTSAWGLYANHDTPADFTNEVAMGHTFAGGALTIGQGVSINFDAAYVDNGGSYGIRLLGPSGFVFSLSFNGGDSVYRYYDGTTSGNSSGVGYNPNGFSFAYTQTGTTTYSVVIKDISGILGSFSGVVSGAPDFIQVYNDAAGSNSNYDVFANNLAIVPEPTSFALIGSGAAVLLAFGYRRRRCS